MIKIAMTYNTELVVNLFTSDDIFPYIADDVSCSKEDWRPDVYESTWLIVYQDSVPVGFIWMEHRSQVLAEVHIGFTKQFNRKNWNETAEQFINVVETKFPYKKLVGMIPQYNKPALFIANRFGFEREGELTKAVLKNGKPHNLIIVGRTLEWDK